MTDIMLGNIVVGGFMCILLFIVARYKWKGLFGIIVVILLASHFGF